MTIIRRDHWENIFRTHPKEDVSWHEAKPETSLAFTGKLTARGARSVIDIGGGRSRLVDYLFDQNLERLAVLDISETALDGARARLGVRAHDVEWIHGDIVEIDDLGSFDVWHDRALFHFLTEASDREHYRRLAERTVPRGGWAVIATFGPDGPERCSGLPVRRYGVEGLEEELGKSFDPMESRIVDHFTPSGRRQQFLYVLFRRI